MATDDNSDLDILSGNIPEDQKTAIKLLTDQYTAGDEIEHGGIKLVREDTERPLYEVYRDGERVDIMNTGAFASSERITEFCERVAVDGVRWMFGPQQNQS